MNLPVESDNEPRVDHNQSNSNTSSGVIERIGQWIDHQEWDVLDQDAELHRDIQICLELLQLDGNAAIHSFGIAHESTGSNPHQAGPISSSNHIKDPTVVELDGDRSEFIGGSKNIRDLDRCIGER